MEELSCSASSPALHLLADLAGAWPQIAAGITSDVTCTCLITCVQLGWVTMLVTAARRRGGAALTDSLPVCSVWVFVARGLPSLVILLQLALMAWSSDRFVQTQWMTGSWKMILTNLAVLATWKAVHCWDEHCACIAGSLTNVVLALLSFVALHCDARAYPTLLATHLTLLVILPLVIPVALQHHMRWWHRHLGFVRKVQLFDADILMSPRAAAAPQHRCRPPSFGEASFCSSCMNSWMRGGSQIFHEPLTSPAAELSSVVGGTEASTASGYFLCPPLQRGCLQLAAESRCSTAMPGVAETRASATADVTAALASSGRAVTNGRSEVATLLATCWDALGDSGPSAQYRPSTRRLRLVYKLHGRDPSELPVAWLEMLHATVAQAGAVLLRASVRRGCIQLVLDLASPIVPLGTGAGVSAAAAMAPVAPADSMLPATAVGGPLATQTGAPAGVPEISAALSGEGGSTLEAQLSIRLPWTSSVKATMTPAQALAAVCAVLPLDPGAPEPVLVQLDGETWISNHLSLMRRRPVQPGAPRLLHCSPLCIALPSHRRGGRGGRFSTGGAPAKPALLTAVTVRLFGTANVFDGGLCSGSAGSESSSLPWEVTARQRHMFMAVQHLQLETDKEAVTLAMQALAAGDLSAPVLASEHCLHVRVSLPTIAVEEGNESPRMPHSLQPGLVLFEYHHGGVVGAARPLLLMDDADVAREISALESRLLADGSDTAMVESFEAMLFDLGGYVEYMAAATNRLRAAAGPWGSGRSRSFSAGFGGRGEQAPAGSGRSGPEASSDVTTSTGELPQAVLGRNPAVSWELSPMRLAGAMPGTACRLLEFFVDHGMLATVNWLLAGMSRHLVLSPRKILQLCDGEGLSLLHRAVRSGRPDMLAMLVRWGLSRGHVWHWGAAGPGGLTPCHLAAVMPDGGVIARRLLELDPAGVSPIWLSQPAADGRTAADYAEKAGLAGLNRAARAFVQQQAGALSQPLSALLSILSGEQPQTSLLVGGPHEVRYLIYKAIRNRATDRAFYGLCALLALRESFECVLRGGAAGHVAAAAARARLAATVRLGPEMPAPAVMLLTRLVPAAVMVVRPRTYIRWREPLLVAAELAYCVLLLLCALGMLPCPAVWAKMLTWPFQVIVFVVIKPMCEQVSLLPCLIMNMAAAVAELFVAAALAHARNLPMAQPFRHILWLHAGSMVISWVLDTRSRRGFARGNAEDLGLGGARTSGDIGTGGHEGGDSGGTENFDIFGYGGPLPPRPRATVTPVSPKEHDE